MNVSSSFRSTERPEGLGVAIVTWPIARTGIVPLENLISILGSFFSRILLISGAAGDRISGSKVVSYSVKYKHSRNKVLKVLYNFSMQVLISFKIIKISREVECFVFFFGGPVLLFPLLTAKLMRKEIILLFAGSDVKDARAKFGNLISSLVSIVTKVNCTLSDKIVVYSESLVKEWGLTNYREKIYIAHEHFLDTNIFRIQKRLCERENIVGFVGRLSEEKGVINLIKALPYLLKQRNDITFFIVGEGPLDDAIQGYVASCHLENVVTLTGWVNHDYLPAILNKLKLLVLPSSTEGLPNIVIEAMACGTPVLATPIGAIKDIIVDCDTGFLMTDDSPECISGNIQRGLNYSSTEQIVKKARVLVEEKYSFKEAVDKFKDIFSSSSSLSGIPGRHRPHRFNYG